MRTVGQGARMVAARLAVGGVLSIWATGALAVLPAAQRAARTDPLGALRGE